MALVFIKFSILATLEYSCDSNAPSEFFNFLVTFIGTESLRFSSLHTRWKETRYKIQSVIVVIRPAMIDNNTRSPGTLLVQLDIIVK